MQKNTLEDGKKLNMRYRVVRSIGQGGFGITYLAEDEVMKQHVVIKEYFPVLLVDRDEAGELLLPELEEERSRYQEGLKRFLNEAKILASLFDVPGIVKVLDYFQVNQTAYIVMEYVKGISLRSYLERMESEFSFEKACAMVRPVMNALEKVHQKGLLHRDINPDNLMVEEDGRIKMLDFGSAREYFLEQDRERTLTSLVKNGYAPPEQYEKRGNQGPWTDIYALCATMYEMMTGCMPPNSMERKLEDGLYAPSAYDVEITPEQEELFLKKGLALEVQDRYRSVREMMEDFFPEEQEKKEKRKNRKKAVLSICALAVAALAAIGYVVFRSKSQQELPYAGSFVRGSKEYEEFMEYVKEFAVATEEYTESDGFEAVRYTLNEETVKEINLPSNINAFRMKADELMEAIKEKGYAPELTGNEKVFEVEEGGYGSIQTSFFIRDNYETPDGIGLEVRYEYFTNEITFIRLINKNGTDADYSRMAAEIIGAMFPHLKDEITADAIWEGKNIFEEQEEKSNQNIQGFETREIYVRFLWRDGVDEATICFFPFGGEYEKPAYRW